MLQACYREYDRELHMVYIDLAKAYDSIPRDLIWYRLRMRQVAEADIDMIKDMYEDCAAKLNQWWRGSGEAADMQTDAGLHQGSVRSPPLL